MQENKLISTIKTLKSFGQTDAISALAKDLKEAYSFALEVLGNNDDVEEKHVIQKESPSITPKKNEDVFKGKFNKYDNKWNLKNKFLYILKIENRFLHFREVAKIILALENKDTSYESQRELSRDLSGNTAIRNYKNEGHIVNKKHNNSPKKSFWGSKKWLDSNDNILPSHMYSLDIMNEKNNESKPDKELEKDLFNI